jgi:hypothetical protein
LGAYVGDTWGGLHRYNLDGNMVKLKDLGCQHPLHFAPSIVQLDRDNPQNRKGSVFVVQVTNSHMDDDTIKFGPSRVVIMKDQADASGILSADSSFGTMGVMDISADTLCAVTGATAGSCDLPMPANARPTMTPSAILYEDGTGFKLFALWYVPTIKGCAKGSTYLTLFDVKEDKFTQTHGLFIAKEPVMGTVFAGNKVFVSGSAGLISLDSQLKNVVIRTGTSGTTPTGGRFQNTGWIEVQ